MSTTHKEAHDEQGQPDRDARRRQARTAAEPPPIVAMFRRLEASMAERDWIVAARLRHLCRILGGSAAVNAA